MKLPDTNIWLALCLSGYSHHQAAKTWLNGESAPDSLLFCRSTQQSLLRLLTTRGVMSIYGLEPLTNAAAWAVYEQFIADERISFCSEPARMDATWKKLAARRTSSPKLWMDAYLGAFAIASSAQIITTDKAFTQFPALDVLVVEL